MTPPPGDNEVLVIVGSGGMGLSIARRVGAGRVIVLADINRACLDSAADALGSDGHQVLTREVDVTSRRSVAALAEMAERAGRVTAVVHTAGLSPQQASAEAVLAVDLLGVALVLDEFGRVIAPGGAGVVIASMAARLYPALDPEVERELAITPTDELLGLEACSSIADSRQAYPFAKRANQIRVAAAASAWAERGARINCISPGIISTAMGRLELTGESGGLMQAMVDNAGLRRIGTPDDIAAAAEFLLGPSASFITGTDLLVDGGVIAAIHTGTTDLGSEVSASSPTVSRGPVEFDPYSEDFFDSPYETYRCMRDEAPVYYSEKYDFWALTRYEDVAVAIKDFESYSSAKGITLDMVKASKLQIPTEKLIIMMDPPEHERFRKLVNRVFTPRAIASLEPMIRGTINSFVKQLDPSSFDAVADFAALFPVEIITTMLGVPAEDRQQMRLWLDKGLEREPGAMGPSAEGVDAMMRSGAYYYELIQKRRAKPQDDMISRLIETEVVADGEVRRLDDIEIAGFASMLGGAGAETVTKLVGNAVVVFADNPDQWQKLQDDRSKTPAAFEELLRYEGPSQYQVRYTTRDVTVRGTTIPAASAVLLINGAASRDERVFPDPDRFDIDRERTFGYNLNFGYGIHSCLGAALARMEGRIALETLLDLIPKYEVDRAGLRRVHMTNVCGWCNVPVRAL